MTDRSVKALLIAGVLVHAGALAAALAGLGGRWPLIGATALVALVVFAVGVLSRGVDTLSLGIMAGTAVTLAAGALRAFSDHPAAAWILGIVFGVQALLQIALLIFFLTFRLNRLW